MRVALVSTFYGQFGGTEKVDNVIGKLFPGADLFLLFGNPSFTPQSLRQRHTSYSILQKIPGILRLYHGLLPLFPYAVQGLDLRGYELIISSDHGLVKGVLTDDDSTHICYCHTPWRQIWDLYRPTLEGEVPSVLRPAYRLTAQYLREVDFNAAQRVDRFCANSVHVARRVQKCYRRDAEVIYPPVDTAKGYIDRNTEDYYLTVGRLSPTKRVDLIVAACTKLGRKLIVCGSGREEKVLKDIAGPTVEFVGGVSDDQLARLYAHCRAFVFAAYEDFGMVVVEAQSYGRPVIAFGKGGAVETVRFDAGNSAENTGILFAEQSVACVIGAIEQFEAIEPHFNPQTIQQNARRFDTSVFEGQFGKFVEDCLNRKAAGPLARPSA